MTPELIADYACHTGENPLWHPHEQRLYWTDIPAGRLFRYDPATGFHEPIYSGRPVGGFTFQADGSLVLFLDRGSVVVWRDGRIERTIIESIPAEHDTRFNDVAADPEGRVFCGSLSPKDAAGKPVHFSRLYRLDCDGSLHIIRDGVITSNGIGFTPDRRGMYYTDTGFRTIWRYDYDPATGDVTDPRVFVEVADAPGEGKPDGLTVDAAGNVWSARWDGGCIVCYGPDGVEKRRVTVPTPKTSCPTFGGTDLSDLYVTTAGGHDRAANGPTAGALYRVRGVAQGVPEFFSRIGI